jgi:hypothetical protein
MNDHEQWEEDVRSRRNVILTVAGAVLLALILLVFWWNNRAEEFPITVATDEPAVVAAEGDQAQPTLPDDAPPTVDDSAGLNPDLNQRTLPPAVPTVGAADDPAANRPAQVGERIVIGGNWWTSLKPRPLHPKAGRTWTSSVFRQSFACRKTVTAVGTR